MYAQMSLPLINSPNSNSNHTLKESEEYFLLTEPTDEITLHFYKTSAAQREVFTDNNNHVSVCMLCSVILYWAFGIDCQTGFVCVLTAIKSHPIYSNPMN